MLRNSRSLILNKPTSSSQITSEKGSLDISTLQNAYIPTLLLRHSYT